MDPITILTIGLPLVEQAIKFAKDAGFIDDAVKWANASVTILGNLLHIVGDIKAGKTDYDSMTPDQIKARLLPSSFEDLEKLVAADEAAKTAKP